MAALDLPSPNYMLPPTDPSVAQVETQRRRMAAESARVAAEQAAAQQRQQLAPLELQQHEQAARVAHQQGLTQTMGADLARWADTPDYRGQDSTKMAPEAHQHFIDAYGEIANEIPGAWNAAQRTATGNPDIGIPARPPGMVGMESQSIDDKGNVHRTRQVDTAPVDPNAAEGDPLAGLPKGEADMARSISTYQFPYASLSRIPGPQRIRILNAAAAINPDFDANQYPTRQATMKSFAAGPDAANIASANTVIGHIDGMLKAGSELHNRSFQPWNKLANAVQSSSGNPAQVNFTTRADAVASELAKLFKGTGAATDQEIKEWRKNLNPSMSPEQIRAVAESAMELMASRLDALKTKYQGGMGKPPERSFLSPKSMAILRQNGLGLPESQPQTEAPPEPQSGPATPQMPTVNSQAEYDALPAGTRYQDSAGNTAVKK